MKSRWMFVLTIWLVAGFVSVSTSHASTEVAVSTTGPQTYTVVVGAEQAAHGIDLEAFFPATLMIHVGDRVHWVVNSSEIHTVSFLAGRSMPDFVIPAPQGASSPVMLNPQVVFPTVPANEAYNGTTFANSGLMSTEPDQAREFNLVFTRTGTFTYVCLVHGEMMSGTIIVVSASQTVPSPDATASRANNEMRALWAQAPQVLHDANTSIQPATHNPDGTLTHYISVGYAQGQIDVMAFFPSKLVAHPGDSLVFSLSASNMAPHTVTFLNDHPDIDLLTVQPQLKGLPLLLLNPAVIFPQQPGLPLTHDGVYSSGFLDPAQPGPQTFTLKIGDTSGYFKFECLLHDTNGMSGSLFVASK